MLMAYILGKDRLWTKKRIFRQKEVFMAGGREYQVHPDCVYMEKVMGVRLRRCIRYVQGIKIPIRFDNLGNAGFTTSEFSLDEAAYIIGKAMKSLMIMLAVIFSAGALCVGIIVAMKVFGMIKGG
jgi:hypothetical protein